MLKPVNLSDFEQFSDLSFSKLEFIRGAEISLCVNRFELLGNTHEKLLEMYYEAQHKINSKTDELMKELESRDDLTADIDSHRRKIEKLLMLISKNYN